MLDDAGMLGAYVLDGDVGERPPFASDELAEDPLLFRPGLGIDDLYELRDIARTGRVVAVTVAPLEGVDTLRILNLMFEQEVQFVHR